MTPFRLHVQVAVRRFLAAGVAVGLTAAALAQGNPLDRSGSGNAGEVIVDDTQDQFGLPVFYEGDGLILSIERIDETTGRVAGRMMMGDAVYDYAGEFESETMFRGAFSANGQQFPFSATENAQGNVVLQSGQSTYTLREVERPSRQFPGAGGGPRPNPDPPVPGHDPHAGQWTGTATEQYPDGSTAQYPVTLALRNMQAQGYAATLSARTDGTDDAGRPITIEIGGTYRGSFDQQGQLVMQSQDMTLRIVEHNQTHQLGAMTLTLAVQAGRMGGHFGNDEFGYTSLELAKQAGGAAPPQHQGGGGFSNNQGGGGQVAPRPAADTIAFKPHVFHDQGLSNMRSHTLLVPDGWQVQGGVQWTPELYLDFKHLNVRVSGPNGAEFAIYPGGMYRWSDIYDMPGAGQKPQPGQALPEGLRFMPLPQTTAEYVSAVVMPQVRPQAQNIQIVSARELEHARKALEEAMRPMLEQMHATAAQDRQMGLEMQMSVFADCVTVSYQEGSDIIQEELILVGWVQIARQAIPGSRPVTTVNWSVGDIHSFKSPAASFKQHEPLLRTVSMSLKTDPQWQAVILDLQAQISRGVIDGIARRGQISREAMQDAFNRHQSTIASQQQSMDRSNQEFLNYITDMQNIRMPDGSVKQVPSTFDNWYSDGNGGLIGTNTPIDNASGRGLTEVQPVR